MLILPLALALPWAGAYRQDGRDASSQMQSNMRPSYILIVLTLETGSDILFKREPVRGELVSTPKNWLAVHVCIVGLPRASARAWSAGFPS